MTTPPRAYSGGHFEMVIDGHKTTSFLKSVEGGNTSTATVIHPTGSDNQQIKSGGVIDIEPFTIDFGLAGAEEVLKWIQGSWRKDWSARNGEIIHADFNLKQTVINEFSDALILETTFPTLDGSSREGAYLKVKFQPEKVVLKQKAGAQVSGITGTKQKQWLSSSFRLNLDGIEGVEQVNKIESFTIKQGVKKFYVGQDRFATLTPTKIEYPTLKCTIAEAYAGDLLKWHQDICKGKCEKQGQITGSLEFLNGEKKTIFRLNLYEVGIANYKIVQSTANEDKIKRASFELFVGKMDLDGSKGLGLE